MGSDFSQELGEQGLGEKIRTQLGVLQRELDADSPDLVELPVSNCGLTDTGIQQGIDSLARSTNLRSIDLGFNNLTGTGAQILCAQLSKCRLGSELRELRLSGNPIGREGCKAVCAYLDETRNQSRLQGLYLFQCDLDDECALMLANSLQLQPSITALNLDMNHFSKKAAIMFAQMLKNNRSLCKLTFSSTTCNVYNDAAMRDIAEALARNTEIVAHKHQIEEIKRKKLERRLRQDEEEKQRNDEALKEERCRVEEELSKLEDMRKQEDETVKALEQKMQDTIAKRNAKAAESAAARQKALEQAINGAYTWREKLTAGGTLQKEWRCGFTILKTEPGQVGGTPTMSTEPPRRLKACWCDPQDATAPYAKTLHYHCKWEDAKPTSTSADADSSIKSKKKRSAVESESSYCGCKSSGHVCASVGFYTSARPDLSAAHFFASPHPGAAAIQEQ